MFVSDLCEKTGSWGFYFCHLQPAPETRAQTNNLQYAEPATDHEFKVCFTYALYISLKFELWAGFYVYMCWHVELSVNVLFGKFSSGIRSYKRVLDA